MFDPSGCWGEKIFNYIKAAAVVVKAAIVVVAVQFVSACAKNVKASAQQPDTVAVDELLQDRIIEEGNVQLPADTEGLLYNKQNREYASKIVLNDLGPNTNRTLNDISSEIFVHQFAADMVRPLSTLSGIVPPQYDVYGRLSRADIDESEARIHIFNIVEVVLEWE